MGCACLCRFEAETNGDYLRILDVSLESISSAEEKGDDVAAAGAAEALEEEADDDTLYRGPVCPILRGASSHRKASASMRGPALTAIL